ncbi:hypothetical protein DL769_005815 [Monosporascus sp. CRB-8-3]|nr:hypothetical protein DL769_005815 [Monosporascus sp. CRB-8-3]
MDPQSQSRFFPMPIEIRQAIYAHIIPSAVHLFLQQDKVAVSACIEPCPERDLSGMERRSTGDWRTDAIMARRLRSSWGPHWKCEEVALGLGGSYADKMCDVARNVTMSAILAACKKMYTDILIFMVNTVTFHVTDLETFKYLVQRNQDSGLSHLFSEGLLPNFCPFLKQLNITLRLHLSFFKTPENAVALTSSAGAGDILKTPDNIPSHLKTWAQIWAALARQLKQLQNLHIWLDTDDKSSWSLVNERAILSHLAALISIGTAPGLKHVSVNLPLLHPRHEKPERHFTNDNPPPPACLTIQRNLRQTFHGKEITPGEFHVISDSEFSILVEMLELPEFEGMSLAEVVKAEQECWRRGQSLEAELRALTSWEFPLL